ncbi:laminin subunit alpha-1-like [Oculina patagonica]
MANRIGEKAKDIGENATKSEMVADDAWEIAEDIERQLTGLAGLKESIILTNRNISEAEKKVMDALNMSQVIKEKMVTQEVRQEQIIEELDTEVVKRLTDIRGMMDRAHELLKYTSLVMKFDGKTTSAPLPPPAVEQDTRSLNFLMYVKPEKPDGLLLFMGDAGSSNNRQKRQSQECKSDFLAVELKAARPHLKMCTSGRYLDVEGEENILTDGKRWYKLEAGMTGDLARLSTTYFDKTPSSVRSSVRALNMDNPIIKFNKNSDLIVGGVPTRMKLPPQVDAVNYTGCFDGLQVNDHFVGSWNSDPLEKPAKDEFCYSRSGDAEFAVKETDPSRTFFGTGFLKSGPYGDDAMGEMDFKFTTTSSNGILVIAIDDDDASLFQAMELSDGHVVFSYNMGFGYRRLSSTKVYDTGDEVSITKVATDFRGDKFDLKITSSQGEEVLANRRPFYPGKRSLNFVNADYVYWGGIENKTTIPANVTKSFFKGCLTSLSLSTGDIKLQPSPGFILGCMVKQAHNVTFLEDHSFLAINPFLNKRRRGFNIGLSFRVGPKTKNGLIFLEAHGEVKDFILLGLVDGKLTFSANAGMLPLTLQTSNKLNDGKWHFVSVQKDGITMHLDVDDQRISGKFQDPMQQYIQTTQDMYLGGVPADYMDTVRNRDFESVILNSLKGGSIRDLTFEHE